MSSTPNSACTWFSESLALSAFGSLITSPSNDAMAAADSRLVPSMSAPAAASAIDRGGGSLGKPCERLVAPCLIASRVISRIVLSGGATTARLRRYSHNWASFTANVPAKAPNITQTARSTARDDMLTEQGVLRDIIPYSGSMSK